MKQQLEYDSVKHTVTLCCGSKRCPQVFTDGEDIKITDDYGQTVTMSQEQAKMISQAVDVLNQTDD
jgi:hypothetical protein